MFKKTLIFLSIGLTTACSLEQRPVFWQENLGNTYTATPVPTVGVLLPLSGESEKVGVSLRNAAMMAAFENEDVPMKVLFFDTESTEEGAQNAYRWSVAQKPDIILGPVFAKEVAAVQESGVFVPILSFTSDTTLLNGKVGTMAVTIEEQVRQMVRQACLNGQLRLGVLAAESKTGEIAMNALSEEMKVCPQMTLNKVSLYAADTMNFTDAVTRLLPPIIDPEKPDLTEAEKLELERPMPERAELDALILFEEGIKLRQLLSLLAFYDVGPKDLPVYALTVVKQVNDPNANFVYFADLDDTNYQNFVRKYKRLFGSSPLRIASQMYDALGFVYQEVAQGANVDLNVLRAKDSYWGVDGMVRLNADGTNRRALQLKQKRSRSNTLILPAETSFDAVFEAPEWSAQAPQAESAPDLGGMLSETLTQTAVSFNPPATE